MHQKNFIKHNVLNVKGSRKPASYLDDDHKKSRSLQKSPPKSLKVQQKSAFHPSTLNKRVLNIEKTIQQFQRDKPQSYIIDQISQIRDDLRMIKSHLFESKKKSFGTDKQTYHQDRLRTNSSGGFDQQNNVNTHNQHLKSQGSQLSFKQSKVSHKVQKQPTTHLTLQYLLDLYEKNQANKKGLNIKVVISMIKEYKIQSPQYGSIFSGYSKRNSSEVVIKYVQEANQLSHLIQVYQKLWKSISLSPWPCVNKIYDYKTQQNNFLIIQKNPHTIKGLPYKSVLIDIFRVLEFIHQCGYLYRNVEAEHFMLNQQGQLVVLDFKRIRRYVDVKGHAMDVQENYLISKNASTFASNNQLRGHLEGRKDDLQSLGYFALLLMNYDIPWYGINKEQTIKIRSTLTLQQLFKGHRGWIQYMALVMRMNKSDRPDYRKLQNILQSI